MILIALGANLPGPAGEPARALNHALGELDGKGVKIRRVSSFYETVAWPNPADPAFINAVALIETRFQPVELLALLHGVETELGRLRSAPNAPRTLDIDLLDYDGRRMTGDLVLPHPRTAERSFVLVPLAEIAPEVRHPSWHATARELLAATSDRSEVRRFEAEQ